MKFAVGLKKVFEQSGIYTDMLRHSVDGTKVISHVKYATPLVPLKDMEIYDADSDEFRSLLSSSEWTKEEYADVEEVFEEVVE